MKLDLNALKKIDWVDLLLRFGDKALLAIAALIFVLALFKTVSALRSVPDVSPTDLVELAESVRNRLSTSNVTDELLAEAGVKNPDFTGLVEELKRDVDPGLVADADLFYRFLDFGGVLREQPEILAPEQLYAAAGRGGVLLYKLDEKGNKIPARAERKTTTKRRRPRRRARTRVSTDWASMMGGMGEAGFGGMAGEEMYGGMMGGMMGGMGGMGGMEGMMGGMEGMMGGMEGYMGGAYGPPGQGGYPGAGGPEGGFPGQPAARPSRQRRPSGDSRRIAGLESKKEDEQQDQEQTTAQTTTPSQYEMEVRGFRWVVITAVYPHQKQLEEYRRALKANESPEYVRVEVQRRVLQSDGTFSDWQPVDVRPNAWIAERRVGTVEEAPILEPYLLDGLVEKLPELAYGTWEFIDHAMAIEAAGVDPRELAQQQQQQAAAGEGDQLGMPGAGPLGATEESMYGAMGGYGYPGGMEGMDAGSMYGMEGGMGYPGGFGGMNPAMAGGMTGGTDGQSDQTGQGMVPPQSAANELPEILVEYLQIRFVDYTVEPGRTYQYRLKVVVKNPNYKRPDVAEEAYRLPEFLEGPWSDPTKPIYVGKDVEFYLVQARFDDESMVDRARFQVHRWDPETGEWFLADFDVVPGGMIGGQKKVKFLTWDEQVEEREIDFTTGAVMLDLVGGRRQIVEQGTYYTYEEPIQALVVTREGELVWRVLADDLENQVRKERDEYHREIRKIIKEIEQAERDTAASATTGGFGGFGTPFDNNQRNRSNQRNRLPRRR